MNPDSCKSIRGSRKPRSLGRGGCHGSLICDAENFEGILLLNQTRQKDTLSADEIVD
jgi:hypothetical protein